MAQLSRNTQFIFAGHNALKQYDGKAAAPPAAGNRLKDGAPPPSRNPTCPGDTPPAPGSRRYHMGRDDRYLVVAAHPPFRTRLELHELCAPRTAIP